jgi:hypothetical protein
MVVWCFDFKTFLFLENLYFFCEEGGGVIVQPGPKIDFSRKICGKTQYWACILKHSRQFSG